MYLGSETGVNASYTIKVGGALKKKVQPMAADKMERGSFAMSSGVTAPGQYEVAGGFGANNQSKKHLFMGKTAAERL
jgi:hypothetical protein